MNSIKEQLIQKYTQLSDMEYFMDDWEPRVTNMLSIACNGRFTHDDIVALKDTSITSNGGSGIVITTQAICVKDLANPTHRFIAYFREIEYCTYEEDRFWGADISRIRLHMKSGAEYKLKICLHGLDLQQMQEFIEFAISLYEDSPAEDDDVILSEIPESKYFEGIQTDLDDVKKVAKLAIGILKDLESSKQY